MIYSSPATSWLFTDMSLLQLLSLDDVFAAVRLHGQKIHFHVIGLSDRRLISNVSALHWGRTLLGWPKIVLITQKDGWKNAIPNKTLLVEILIILKKKLSVICDRLRRYGEIMRKRSIGATRQCGNGGKEILEWTLDVAHLTCWGDYRGIPLSLWVINSSKIWRGFGQVHVVSWHI